MSEYFRDFSVIVPRAAPEGEAPTVAQLLESYFAEAHVDYICETCTGKVSTVQHTVDLLPRVLVLHLKRFQYDPVEERRTKTLCPVVLTPVLDLAFCMGERARAPPARRPYAVDASAKAAAALSAAAGMAAPTPPPAPGGAARQLSFGPKTREEADLSRAIAFSEETAAAHLSFEDQLQWALEDSQAMAAAVDTDGDSDEAVSPVVVAGATQAAEEATPLDHLKRLHGAAAATPVSSRYRLNAVIRHTGTTPYAGHYVCDVRDWRTGKWFTYNDSVVTRVRREDMFGPARQKFAYLLFYQHIATFS